MSKECKKCKGANKRMVYIEYEATYFHIKAKEEECFDCAKKRCLKVYKEAREMKIVEIKENRLEVNWKLFIDSYRWPEIFKCNNKCTYHDFIYFLIELNIFSNEVDGNYEVYFGNSGHPLILPNKDEKRNYFVRGFDAIEYMKFYAPSAAYPWEVRKMEVVKQYNPKNFYSPEIEQV